MMTKLTEQEIQEKATQMVELNEQENEVNEVSKVDEINKSHIMLNKAISDVNTVEEKRRDIRQQSFSSTEEEFMESIEENIINDGALKLIRNPEFWTFDDIKKHFMKDGELIDVDLDLTDEEKKEYMLDYSKMIYTNHYALKELDRLSLGFQNDIEEFNKEVNSELLTLDVQEHMYENGVTDFNSIHNILLQKDIADYENKEELDDEETEKLRIAKSTLETLSTSSVQFLIDFIKTRTSKQILNTHKKNAKGITNHLLSRQKEIGMRFDNQKWIKNVKNFENRVFEGENVGKVGNMFIFIFSYYLYNRKDQWSPEDVVITRRVLSDLLFLFDDSIELSEDSINRKEEFISDIREVISIVIEKIEGSGKDYVKVFN